VNRKIHSRPWSINVLGTLCLLAPDRSETDAVAAAGADHVDLEVIGWSWPRTAAMSPSSPLDPRFEIRPAW